MLRSPVLAIIALLVVCGAAMMLETHHRILIVATDAADTAPCSNIDRPDETSFGPASAPTFAPADPPHLSTEE